MSNNSTRASAIALLVALCGSTAAGASPRPIDQQAEPKPEFPPFESVSEGLTQVVSTTDGSTPLYELWSSEKEGKLLAVLPSDFASQMLMIACTVSGGDPEAGVMGPTHYVKWRRIGKQLALVAPDLSVRSKDAEAKVSFDELFMDTVIVSVPIASMKDGRPVVDFGAMATQQSSKFFGSEAPNYGPALSTLNATLATLRKAKAFPENVVVEYEAPRADGRFVRVTYAIGLLKESPGFQSRKADPRVGYFYDWHMDYSRTGDEEVAERYITRWNLEKADPKLKMSPPKQPIVWYVEHTTPIRYRRYVREGIEMWNKAFEKVGIVDAVDVRQQDEATGAHMDIDPEDARYNFFRWNMSDETYAIGPSRTNPLTGEILDADIVWNQGLTRSVGNMLDNLTEDLTEASFSPDTLAWLDEHPSWDPRVRLAGIARREQIVAQRGLAVKAAAELELSSDEHPWTMGSNDPTNRACKIGNQLSMDLSLAGVAFATGLLDTAGEEALDDLPEPFLGGMIRYISAHECGHTLGLQHNMAASTIRSLAAINAEGFEGPTVGSVMDYAAANINHDHHLGAVQGPYATAEVGPYDYWAIRYGYGPEDQLATVLSEVSNPDHVFVSQIAMSIGSDPRNMTWDLGADNLNFCESRMRLVNDLRAKLVAEVTKDGDSWAEVRRRFISLMGTQLQSLFIASSWIGSSFENYDFKGDPGARTPVADVPAAEQRRAVQHIVKYALEDDALGLTPELVRHLGKEYWFDPKGFDELIEDPNFTVHDAVGGIQATGLTLLLSPSRLRRVYDNEFRAAKGEDPVTMAEIVGTVTKAVWEEGEVSSFRRNLQREHVERLIDLALLDSTSPSLRAIGTLATHELRGIDATAEKAQSSAKDAYAKAHLSDIRTRIAKALDAAYVIAR